LLQEEPRGSNFLIEILALTYLKCATTRGVIPIQGRPSRQANEKKDQFSTEARSIRWKPTACRGETAQQ